jgi:photosystem II stability/assembly factor-like uncharacterized protein
MTMEEFANIVCSNRLVPLADDTESVEDKLTYRKEVSKIWFVEGDAEVAVFNTQAAAEEWKQINEMKGKVAFRNILTIGDLNGG